MPAERHDHFQRMRSEEVPTDIPEGAPHVSPELIAYLEKEFTFEVLTTGALVASSLDSALQLSHQLAQYHGARALISHLKTLVRTA